jgi:hypothetical protein
MICRGTGPAADSSAEAGRAVSKRKKIDLRTKQKTSAPHFPVTTRRIAWKAGVSTQVTRASDSFCLVGRKHIAEGASCESNSSWLPIHKTAPPANPLLAAKNQLQLPQPRVVAEFGYFSTTS